MTLVPLYTADPIVQFHVVCALFALVLGPVALYRRRRDRVHKLLGYSWVCAIAGVALSSFGIHSFAVIGPFSPIHALSLFTLWSLYEGLRLILSGRVIGHRIVMRNLYWYGLCVAGLFNFLPGRTMNKVLLGGQDGLGYVVTGIGLVLILLAVLRGRRAALA
ncbi:MAG: DUF2306 domain-containing protein [Pseudomonadota bacterium]